MKVTRMSEDSASQLDASYRLCDTFAQKSNFYSGFRLLPSRKHRALSAVYAFLRQCDDISDTDGSVEDKKQEYAKWKTLFEEAMHGGSSAVPTLPALRDAVRTFGIPLEYFFQLMEGTQMDLTIASYGTFEELYRYCYHVASVVGLICIHIFQFQDPRATECAKACGIAFQLTNILRDVKEDLQRGRIYLPAEDLQRFQYSPDDLRREIRDARFVNLMKFEADRARSYYEKAAPLTDMLERDSRPAFRAMFESYRALLKHIEKNNYDVLSRRVRLRKDEKLGIMLRALVKR
jgi:phytoene synthase